MTVYTLLRFQLLIAELHCRTSLIIEAVDRLCSAHHSNLTMEIKQLLDVPDLHRY